MTTFAEEFDKMLSRMTQPKLPLTEVTDEMLQNINRNWGAANTRLDGMLREFARHAQEDTCETPACVGVGFTNAMIDLELQAELASTLHVAVARLYELTAGHKESK